ncbi:MAG: LemA family protein [Patescibacteria group bacterium]
MAVKIKPLYWVLGVIAVLVLWFGGTYNSLVGLQTKTDSALAQIEVQYQRRADLVPQLVATVQGAANFEKGTLTAVTEARTQWLNVNENPGSTLEQKISASNNFDSALSRLLVTVEAYPNLTATENFRTLQDQLEGTENRVAVARKDFNDVVTSYNTKIRRFPSNLVAGMFGFEKYPFFEAAEGSDKAPEVKFDDLAK